MIVIEEKHEKKSDGKSNEDPLDFQVPKVDEPTSIKCRIECSSVRQFADLCRFQFAREMSKSRPKYCGNLPDHG